MKLALLGLTALFPVALAQGPNTTYLAGLAQALSSAGLTQLLNSTTSINGTTAGSQLLTELSNGNYTVFAPDNAALKTVARNISSNANLLAAVLSYHVVRGNFTNDTTTSPNNTIGRTLLNDTSLVSLEGNKSQVLAWTTKNGTITVLNQATNVTVSNKTTYENLVIYAISGFLQPPGNLSTVLTTQNLTQAQKLLANLTIYNTSTSAISTLESAKGYTFFVPNDASLLAVISSLPNSSVEGTVLANHYVNGSTIYSPSFSPSSNLTSAGGEPLSFSTNSSGTYVHSGNSSAQIITTDVLVSNGVVHVIDGVLVNLESNTAAASSAYASATSVATQSSTETGPVGSPTSSGSKSSKGGATSLTAANGISGVLVVLGAIVAGGMLLV